jgi:hypothetical protein
MVAANDSRRNSRVGFYNADGGGTEIMVLLAFVAGK